MIDRAQYVPGPARDARVEKGRDLWTLVLVRELRHPLAMVWEALTDPAQLAEWAPFDADRNLATPGPATITMARTPKPTFFATAVKRAEAPSGLQPGLLEYSWGGSDLRWKLEALGSGTRLTLWHSIDHRYVTWGAAGWHICMDVLDRLLAGAPIGRIAGTDAVQYGWQRLVGEYAQQFGIEANNQKS
jgi:uncharacterized protein YndB with AHSA1/START domain